MKTAISIPDDLFVEADAFAKKNHLNRSELYVQALTEHLRRAKISQVGESFNEAYGDDDESDAWGNLSEFRRAVRSRKAPEPWSPRLRSSKQ